MAEPDLYRLSNGSPIDTQSSQHLTKECGSLSVPATQRPWSGKLEEVPDQCFEGSRGGSGCLDTSAFLAG